MAFTLTKRSALKFVLLATALGAGAVGLGNGLAAADNNNMTPNPYVKSSQGEVRKNGTQGEMRGTEILEVGGQGDVRESDIAVPQTKARGFQGVRVGPAIGGW
jgi:hypothetical protein